MPLQPFMCFAGSGQSPSFQVSEAAKCHRRAGVLVLSLLSTSVYPVVDSLAQMFALFFC